MHGCVRRVTRRVLEVHDAEIEATPELPREGESRCRPATSRARPCWSPSFLASASRPAATDEPGRLDGAVVERAVDDPSSRPETMRARPSPGSSPSVLVSRSARSIHRASITYSVAEAVCVSGRRTGDGVAIAEGRSSLPSGDHAVAAAGEVRRHPAATRPTADGHHVEAGHPARKPLREDDPASRRGTTPGDALSLPRCRVSGRRPVPSARMTRYRSPRSLNATDAGEALGESMDLARGSARCTRRGVAARHRRAARPRDVIPASSAR